MKNKDRSFDVTINTYRAGSVGFNQPKSARIEILQPIDDIKTTVDREFYAEEGKRLADVLFESLPGGTLDALLCEMMQRRASLLKVPW